MNLAAAGAFVGVLWALLSIVQVVLQEPGATEAYRFLGIRSRYLIAASSVLLTVGIMGHLLSAARTRRRRRADLTALHSHLVDAVAESMLPAVRSEVAEYHRTIEIMDALATLARYSDPRTPDGCARSSVPHPSRSCGPCRSTSPPPAAGWTTDRTCLPTGTPGRPTTVPCVTWGAPSGSRRARGARRFSSASSGSTWRAVPAASPTASSAPPTTSRTASRRPRRTRRTVTVPPVRTGTVPAATEAPPPRWAVLATEVLARATRWLRSSLPPRCTPPWPRRPASRAARGPPLRRPALPVRARPGPPGRPRVPARPPQGSASRGLRGSRRHRGVGDRRPAPRGRPVLLPQLLSAYLAGVVALALVTPWSVPRSTPGSSRSRRRRHGAVVVARRRAAGGSRRRRALSARGP
ncbi:DUF6545 domain-containing protein [Oerskovia sp. M15]